MTKIFVSEVEAYDPRTPLEKIYCVFKENTAQFVLIIPFIYGTLKFIFNVILYQCQKGYYNYFNIDDIFIDFDSKISLYNIMVTVGLGVIIILYSVFAVLTIRLKRPVAIAVFWGVIPLLVALITAKYFYLFSSKAYLRIILIVYSMCNVIVFALGGCMFREVLDYIAPIRKPKNTQGKPKKSYISDNAWRLIGVLLITLGCVAAGINGYNMEKSKAADIRTFDIIQVDNKNYARVSIYQDYYYMISCQRTSKDTLTLNTNLYRLESLNKMEVSRETFKNIIIKN